MSEARDVIHTRIWEEVPEPDNPFAAAACHCSGYDVDGDLLGKASGAEYLYLLLDPCFNPASPNSLESVGSLQSIVAS